MQLSHSFRVDRPPPEVFDAFLDIERVAGCMPGSRIVGRSADDAYDGEVEVKIGPMAVAYSGQLHVLDADRDRLRLTMRARGREQRGAGNADAYVVAQLSAHDGGTLVEIDTELNIRGKVAQFGRGVITEVSDGFMQTFAANLEDMLAPAVTPSPGTTAADELNAWSLALRPLVQRHARSVAVAALCGVAAYIGARVGVRRALRRTPYHTERE